MEFRIYFWYRFQGFLTDISGKSAAKTQLLYIINKGAALSADILFSGQSEGEDSCFYEYQIPARFFRLPLFSAHVHLSAIDLAP